MVEAGIGRQRHGAHLNHVDRLKESGLLLPRRLESDFRKVELPARFLYIARNQPVGGDYLVEPRKLRFVGVAVVTGITEDLADLGRGLNLGGDWRVLQRCTYEL